MKDKLSHLISQLLDFRVVVPFLVVPAMVIFLCACEDEDDDGSGPASVDNPSSTSITSTTAVLGGRAGLGGSRPGGFEVAVSERGVIFSITSENANPQIDGTSVTKLLAATNGSGFFTVSVSGLLPSTEYSFRAFAIGQTTAYTLGVDTFTTLPPGPPTVTDPTSADNTVVSATLGGNVLSDGGNTITARGVVYAITTDNADPLIGGADVVNVPHASQETGVFTLPVTRLDVSADYTFKAYATNSAGTSYSELANFSTDLPADTGILPAFEGGAYEPMHVSAMAIQPDGKTLIGGSFAAVGNVSHSCLVRLNADGSVDHSFAPHVTGSAGEWVTCIAVQPDGKIVIGGNLSHVDGERHENIARLNTDGSVDSSFTAAANYGFVNCLALQADGKILLGGTFLGLNPADNDFGVGVGANYWWLGRLNADGSVDTGFNHGAGGEVESNDPNNPVNSIAVMADGKIMVCGSFTTYNGVERNSLARLETDGTLDTSFVPALGAYEPYVDVSYCVVEQANGKILVGGARNSETRLERLNADGSLDPGFTSGVDDFGVISSVVLQADGKMLVCSRDSETTPGHFTRLNADGSLDSTFDPGTGPNNYVEGIAIRENGKIMACGTFTMVDEMPTTAFVQFDNGEAIQNLISPDSSRVQWLRGGTAPELTQVTFDLSTDSGTTWTPLGAGSRALIGWELNGQSLPASGMLRARGRTSGGNNNGSSGLTEQVATFPSAPLIAQLTSSDITGSSAVLGSNIFSDEGSSITERGVIYALSSDNTDPLIGGSGVTTVMASTTTTGVFTQLIEDLEHSSKYTYRAYAKSSAGTGYSGVQTFTTSSPPTVTSPTSGSQSPLADSSVQVTLGGEVTSDGGSPISERGVVYSLTSENANPEIGGDGVVAVPASGTALGVFTATAMELSPNSSYSFKAYAKNEVGDGYSSVSTFDTLGPPKIASSRTGLATATSITLIGTLDNDGGDPVTERGFVYGKEPSSGRLQTDDGIVPIPVVIALTGTFETTISGLETGVKYYFTAYAKNSYGMSDRVEGSFTLEAAPAAAPPSESSSGSTLDIPPLNSAATEAGYDPDISSGYVQALAIQPDGKAIVAGFFGDVGGVAHRTLARLNTDGSVDPSFAPQTDGVIYSVVVQENGKILLGGAFSTVNTENRSGIARLNADGSLESAATFNSSAGADNIVYSMVLQPDGKILLAGLFDNIQSTARSGIARLNANGSVDGTFDPGTGADDAVYSMALQTDGKILIGGAFQDIAGTARNRIARLNSNGALDTTFAPSSGADEKVDCILVQPDGNILIGGYFTSVNSTARNRIARLTSTGALDTSFDPGTGADNVIYSLTLQNDGKVLLGGIFQNVNSTARNSIARLNADGSHDTSFDPGTGANEAIDGIALQADGNILIAGHFTQYNSIARNRMARIDNDAVTQSLTIANSTQAQWMRSGAGPEVSTVTFQLSTDGGSTWTTAGSGTRIAGGWQGTGLSLPLSGTLRAVGRTSGGFLTASSGLISESTVFALDPGDIQVEQPVATILSSGNIQDLGGVLLADFSQRTFTINNTGLGHLAGIQVGITGPQASHFTLDSIPATSLAASGSTTFVLRFAPSSLGAKTAQLQITSNDPDESPINITLKGTGTTPLGIWRQTNFGVVTNSGVGAHLYDPDGDGLVNLIEYAFGLDPTLASSNQLPSAQMSGGNLFFDFTAPAGISDIIYGAEWSTSLQGGEWTNIPDTGTPPLHHFSVPASGDTEKFIRLKVTAP